MPKPISPVAPSDMELIFFYVCPKCKTPVAVPSPTQPATTACTYCNFIFPILPVDARGVQYVKLMMGRGLSAMDLDFY